VERPIHVSTIESASQAKFCESAESGHSNHSDSDTVSKLLGITAPPIRMDSQCKYGNEWLLSFFPPLNTDLSHTPSPPISLDRSW